MSNPTALARGAQPLAVYVLALGGFGIITTEFGVIGILPQLAKAFRVSIDQASWLLSGFALTIAVAGPFVTLAMSAVDRKVALTLVLALFVASNLASVYAPSFLWLLLARILPAFFHPVFWSVAMTVAATSGPPAQAPKAVATVFAGLSLATVLGVPLASLFADSFGWQSAFLVCAAINLLALLSHLLLLPSMPVPARLSYGHQLGVLKKPVLWWNLTIQVLLVSGTFAIYSFLAEYLKQVTAMDGKSISAMLLLFGMAGFFGNLQAGRLVSQGVGRAVWIFLASFSLTLLLVFALGQLYAAMVALIAGWGFVHAGSFLLGQTLVTRAAPEAPEFSNSLFASSGNLGLTIGTSLGGLVITTLGVRYLPLASIGLFGITALVFYRYQQRYAIPSSALSSPQA